MPGFRFGPGIAHRDETRRALESLRRSVDEDGSPESEFALGLALALVSRRVTPRVHVLVGIAGDGATGQAVGLPKGRNQRAAPFCMVRAWQPATCWVTLSRDDDTRPTPADLCAMRAGQSTARTALHGLHRTLYRHA